MEAIDRMLEEIREVNEVYYCIYACDYKLVVRCLQWFDELHMDERRFLRDSEGNRLYFNSEEEAEEFLNTLYYF